jgi:hypothetical protein
MAKAKPIGTTRVNHMGYVQIKIRKGERRWPFLHHVIWESVHGPIPNGFHIHHKNGNKTDNKIENLELYETHAEHTKRHLEKAIEWGRKLGSMGKGVPKSPEHRAKISAANKGKPKSPEHRQKLADALRGRSRPDISACLKGRKLRGQHRIHVIAAAKNRPRNPATGQFSPYL